MEPAFVLTVGAEKFVNFNHVLMNVPAMVVARRGSVNARKASLAKTAVQLQL